MGDVQKVNVGRVLDKIQIAMGEFVIGMADPGSERTPQDDTDMMAALREALDADAATGLQTIVRGRRGDGEIEIRYNNHGVTGTRRLHVSGTLTDVGSQTETDVGSGAAQLFIAALYGEEESSRGDGPLDGGHRFLDPFWRGMAAYAKCRQSSPALGCRSVLNEWKGPVAERNQRLDNLIAGEERKLEALLAAQTRKQLTQLQQQVTDLRDKPQVDEYVDYAASAIILAYNLRDVAKMRASSSNTINPVDVDTHIGRYEPAYGTSALGADPESIPLRAAHNLFMAAQSMLREIFQTPTGEALFWDVSSPLFVCKETAKNRTDCDVGYREDLVKTCSIVGITKEQITPMDRNCRFNPPERSWGHKDF